MEPIARAQIDFAGLPTGGRLEVLARRTICDYIDQHQQLDQARRTL